MDNPPDNYQKGLCTLNLHYLTCMLPWLNIEIGHTAQHNELWMERGMQMGKKLAKHRQSDPERVLVNNILERQSTLRSALSNSHGQPVALHELVNEDTEKDRARFQEPLQMVGPGKRFNLWAQENRELLQAIRAMLRLEQNSNPNASAWHALLNGQSFPMQLVVAQQHSRASIENGHVVISTMEER